MPQCRWGPVVRPVRPIRPITWPAWTWSPRRIQMAIDVVIGTGPNLHAHTTGGVLDGLDHLARPPGPHRGMNGGGDIKPVVGLRLSVRTEALSVMTGVAEKLVDRKHPMGPGADGLASGWFSLAQGEQEDEQWPE